MTILQLNKVAIALFFTHAVEEYISGFYLTDPLFLRTSDVTHSAPQTVFFVEQFLLLALLTFAIYKPRKIVCIIIGLLLVSELIHLILAIFLQIYSGLLTSLPLVLLGALYWKRLLASELFSRGPIQ